jgi:hypothetical protein
VDASAEWEATTDGDGDVDVRTPTALDVRVFKCSNAFATKRFNATSTEATVAFDYEVESEEWYEAPYLIVREGGEIVYESQNIDTDDKTFTVESYGTASGSFERTVSVSDPFTIEMGIRPSNYCSAGDHANTFFRVRGLSVE